MSVDMSIKVDPSCSTVTTQVTLVHYTILIWGQGELVFARLIFWLDIAIDSISIGHNTCGLGFGLPVVKDAIV